MRQRSQPAFGSTLRFGSGVLAAVLVALLLDLSIARPIGSPGTGLEGAIPPSGTPVASAPASPTPGAVGIPPDVQPSPDVGAGTARPPVLPPLDAAQVAALQLATERARQAFDLDALAIGVSYGGARRWSGASGLARDGVTPLSGDSPFVVASITKTYVASVVLLLVEERRMGLEDAVVSLVPGIPVAADVTVAQLLDHTSGVADLFNPLRDDLNRLPDRIWSPDDVLARMGAPWFAAGQDWAYSNTNYLLLGMIIERITGRPLADEVALRLLRPLGLDDSGTVGAAGSPPLLPPSWASAFWASGSMYASADDLLVWGEALYGGSVLSEASLDRMLAFNSDGYGLGVERMNLGGAPAYGHSGLLKGFTTLLVFVPELRLTVALLGTSSQRFNPGEVLSHAEPGTPSLLDLAQAYLPAGRCPIRPRTGCP